MADTTTEDEDETETETETEAFRRFARVIRHAAAACPRDDRAQARGAQTPGAAA
jgi:hypothetical protein